MCTVRVTPVTGVKVMPAAAALLNACCGGSRADWFDLPSVEKATRVSDHAVSKALERRLQVIFERLLRCSLDDLEQWRDSGSQCEWELSQGRLLGALCLENRNVVIGTERHE